ncbi:hypothetical protein LCL95_10000 [Bacillus timonensis]|nr:hypothetical protein [Bacillus timonensis]
MIVKVNTKPLKEKFDLIYKKVYSGLNFELEDFYGQNVERYLIFKKDEGKYIGTIEIILNYKEHCKYYEGLYPFSKVLSGDLTKTCIIQKVTILKDYEGKGYLISLLEAIYKTIIEYSLTHGVALIEPRLYLILKKRYKLSIKRPTGAKSFFYKGGTVVPVLIDLEKSMNFPMKMGWYDKEREETLH